MFRETTCENDQNESNVKTDNYIVSNKELCILNNAYNAQNNVTPLAYEIYCTSIANNEMLIS